jgi:hypothetical protein
MSDKTYVTFEFVTAMYSNNAEQTTEVEFTVPETWARDELLKLATTTHLGFADFKSFVEKFGDLDEEVCDRVLRDAATDGVIYHTNIELNSIDATLLGGR